MAMYLILGCLLALPWPDLVAEARQQWMLAELRRQQGQRERTTLPPEQPKTEGER